MNIRFEAFLTFGGKIYKTKFHLFGNFLRMIRISQATSYYRVKNLKYFSLRASNYGHFVFPRKTIEIFRLQLNKIIVSE